MKIKLKVHNPTPAKLVSCGYYGEPKGLLKINENGTYEVKPYAEVEVNVPLPTGRTIITENGIVDVYEYAEADVQVPLPSGSIEINENGSANVYDYAEAIIRVPQIIPISEHSLKPSAVGIDSDGVYLSDTLSDLKNVSFGRNENNNVFVEEIV